MKKLINQPEFKQWIERSLDAQENILAVSNQGTILFYSHDGLELIVKTAMGSGLLLKARQKTHCGGNMRHTGAWMAFRECLNATACWTGATL